MWHPDNRVAKEIGRALLAFGIPFVGAISGFLIQYGANETRLAEVESHTKKSHPSADYRRLQTERHQSLLDADKEIRRRLITLENKR